MSNLPSVAVLLHWFQISFTFYSLYAQNAFPFGNLGFNNTTEVALKPVRMPGLSTSYSIEVAADRAILEFQVSSEGTNQDKVADEIRDLQNDVMGTLQPLTSVLPNSSQQVNNGYQQVLSPHRLPAITHLGVNTFQASRHRVRSTLLGDKPLYEAKVDFDVEFADLDALGRVMGKLIRMPRAKMGSLTWKLSDDEHDAAQNRVQQGASTRLMSKARNFAGPLGLDNVRALSVDEEAYSRRSNVQAMAKRTEPDMLVLSSVHDEMDAELQNEPLRFEAKNIEFVVELRAEFEAW